MPTLISWTNETLNPITGCSHASPGCKHCYAEALSLRYKWSKKPWTHRNAPENIKFHPDRLQKPYRWKEPRLIFLNSMSDMLHPLVPNEWRVEVMRMVRECHWHTFQTLTKHGADNDIQWHDWPPNLWFGVSVEDRKRTRRIDWLRSTGAALKWISFEPLLEDVMPYDLSGVDWCVIGGESGPGYRKMPMAAARSIRDECQRHGIPYFFKQDSAFVTETRPWLVEEDGRCYRWQQYPGQLTPPELVEPTAKAKPALRILQ